MSDIETAERTRNTRNIQSDAEEPWAEPEPVSSFTPPPVPEAVLTGPIGDVSRVIAATYQVPIDFPLLTAIGVISAATLNRAELVIDSSRGWKESLSIYAMPVLPSGSNKTSSAGRIVEPLRSWDIERVRDFRRSGLLDDLQIAEERLEIARRTVVKARPASTETTDDARADFEAARGIVEELKAQAVHSYLVDDATPEAIVSRLAAAGCLAMFSTEGGFIANLAGRYSTDVNLDAVLKAHDGNEGIRVDRKGTGTIEIHRPFLTMVLGVQPDVLREIREEPAMLRRGFLARFLTVTPDSILGRRVVHPPALDLDVLASWDATVRGILDRMPGDPEHRLRIVLDGDALRLLDGFRGRLEPRLGDFGDIGRSDALRSWAGKLSGALARIAAIYAIAEDPRTGTVSGEIMRATLELGPYLIAHAKQAHHPRSTSPEARLLEWLRRSRPWLDTRNTRNIQSDDPDDADSAGIAGIAGIPRAFTTREVFDRVRDQTSWVDSVDTVRAALDVLEESGWIRKAPRPAGKVGRPSEIWIAHPSLDEEAS